jgi:hypothetical protein
VSDAVFVTGHLINLALVGFAEITVVFTQQQHCIRQVCTLLIVFACPVLVRLRLRTVTVEVTVTRGPHNPILLR